MVIKNEDMACGTSGVLEKKTDFAVANLQKELDETKIKLTISNNLLQKRRYELEALKSLSDELTDIIDLEQAVDIVNRYLWEILDYSVAAYMIFDPTDKVFDCRVYLKESVSERYLDVAEHELMVYIALNAQSGVSAFAKDIIDKNERVTMKKFGLSEKVDGSVQPKSGFIISLGIGDKTLGALYISSSKDNLYTTDGEQELVRTMASIASISIARLQEMINSQHSMNESLVESLNNGVIMFDAEQRVILMNPAAQKMTGLMREGYSVTELYSLFPNIKLKDMIEKSIKTGKVMHIEGAQVSRFFYEIYVSPVRDFKKRIIGGSIIIHDVTHLKEVDRMKTDFVSVASHQLRTPLTAINWYTEMLQSGDAGDLNQKQRDFLAEIYKGGVRMVQLVNDLLNVSRLETGRLKIDPKLTDLVEFIEDVIHELEVWSKGRKCGVIFQKPKKNPSKIAIDSVLMRQVIHNLITNAVRYSPANGEVVINLLEKGEKYLVSVADQGIGIPKDAQGKIFQKFFRADNARAVEGEGSGIGLYIAKMIMEASAGRLWFVSPTLKKKGIKGGAEGYGTTFYVTIPKHGMAAHEGERGLAS